MNSALDWLKKNWIIAALTVLMLVSMPTMLYFSGRMGRTLREEVQKKVNADMQELTASKVGYEVKTPDNRTALETTDVANPALIAWYGERQKELQEQGKSVGEAALAFNRGEHAPLIEGIFPEPIASETIFKVREFARRLVEDTPKELLARVRAGMPPDPLELKELVNDFAAQQSRQVLERSAVPSDEEIDRVYEQLSDLRFNEYRRRAGEIAVYADRSVFGARIPPAVPTDPPALALCWLWQEQHWIHEDLLDAIAAVNGTSGESADGSPGAGGGVPASVVKRINAVVVDAAKYSKRATYQAEEFELKEDELMRGARTRTEGIAPTNPAASITGRISGPNTSNTVFDLRNATLDVIVSSRRLPQFFDALAAQNFITVLDCDLEAVEPREHLAQGFYYGDEHVVRARIKVETAWLREWTAPLMPPEIRLALKIADKPKPAEATPDGPG